MAVTSPGGARRSWAKDTPPLAISAVAMLLLLAVMPSALNLPQSNPSEQLEYAPVPPEDDNDITPPAGNFASLGLGSSGSLGVGAQGDGPGAGPGGALPGGKGARPSTKRCVGNPPKQTGDPLAPPCVAYYAGDNGGATYPGVTPDEIRVVVYSNGGYYSIGTSKGQELQPTSGIIDMDKPPEGEEHTQTRAVRALSRFFNERFQTYNRHVHVWMYWSVANPSAERLRADAMDIYNKLKPFAVLPVAGVDPAPMVDPLGRRGVMVIGSSTGRPASFYEKYPGLLWGYLPSIEKQAEVFASWVCKKVVGRPVSFSGNADDMGKPRVLGLMYTSDSRYPGLTAFAMEVERRVEACGGSFREKRATPYAGLTVQADQSDDYPVENMSAFVAAGVTTVIWAQGYETRQSRAAASLNYRPEWFTAGDGDLEGWQTNQYQEQSVWRYAWTVSNVVMEGPAEGTPCVQAILEADPEFGGNDAEWVCAFYSYYVDMRQLFTGIQVAGPKLSPASMDKGYHAIPRVESSSPAVPACYYDPGDYTCVKDAMAMWWDPDGTAPNSDRPGCYRAVEGGRRFIGPSPPDGDPTAQKRPDDPCSTYIGGITIGG